MNQFVKTKLFSLIEETAKRNTPVVEWEKSYRAFAGKVFAAGAKMERVVFHNSLCFVRAELAFWQSQNSLKKKRIILFLY